MTKTTEWTTKYDNANNYAMTMTMTMTMTTSFH